MSRNFLQSGATFTRGEQVIGFSGPRELSAGEREFVGQVVETVLSTPLAQGIASRRIVTGCAVGVDEVVIDVVNEIAAPMTVFTILDENGNGGWADTNIEGVAEALKRGATIFWLAGGRLNVPLAGRLRGRSIRMLDTLADAKCGSGLVAFWKGSRGTRMTIEQAIRRKLPTVVYPLGNLELPRLPGGHWVKRKKEGIKGLAYAFLYEKVVEADPEEER